jgi:hypothetical protein
MNKVELTMTVREGANDVEQILDEWKNKKR